MESYIAGDAVTGIAPPGGTPGSATGSSSANGYFGQKFTTGNGQAIEPGGPSSYNIVGLPSTTISQTLTIPIPTGSWIDLGGGNFRFTISSMFAGSVDLQSSASTVVGTNSVESANGSAYASIKLITASASL